MLMAKTYDGRFLNFCSKILFWSFKVLFIILGSFSILKDHNLAPNQKLENQSSQKTQEKA